MFLHLPATEGLKEASVFLINIEQNMHICRTPLDVYTKRFYRHLSAIVKCKFRSVSVWSSQTVITMKWLLGFLGLVTP